MNMTEPGKHLTPRPRDLTEDAVAPSTEPGQPRIPPCGNEWCTDTECMRPTYQRWVTRMPETIAYHTQHGHTIALAYAVQNLARYQRLVDEHDRVCEARERHAVHAANVRNAKSKLGPWEFTLTYSPAKHGWSVDEAKDAMRTAMERLTRYYREELEELHATGEYTQAGHPHVHCWYRLTGGHKITTKSFKRAYPVWNPKHKTGPRGHEGGHHEPVKRTSDFAGYVEKDLQTAWLKMDITNDVRPAEEAYVSEAEDDDQAEVVPPQDDTSA